MISHDFPLTSQDFPLDSRCLTHLHRWIQIHRSLLKFPTDFPLTSLGAHRLITAALPMLTAAFKFTAHFLDFPLTSHDFPLLSRCLTRP